MDFINCGSKRMLSCYRVFALAVFQPAIFFMIISNISGLWVPCGVSRNGELLCD